MKEVTTYRGSHSTYGGIIDLTDFSTNSPNKRRISNQINAETLPDLLESQKNKRREYEKYKHMTLEELKEMKIISNTTGRPISSLTNELWQKEFNIRKLFITPYPKTIKKMGGKFSKEYGKWNEDTRGTYYGTTNYQEYCSYINDVLCNIRSGQIDYCYFMYQILDLLKFHFDDLRTKYCDGYWKVWLERKIR